MPESQKVTETKTVKVILPLLYGAENEEEPMYVAVNGNRYLIKRGVEVEVPYEVAVVIRDAMRQEEEARKFRRSNI